MRARSSRAFAAVPFTMSSAFVTRRGSSGVSSTAASTKRATQSPRSIPHPTRTLAGLGGRVQQRDVMAGLEWRVRGRRLAGDVRGLERRAVGLYDAEAKDEPRRRRHLRLFVDRLLRLDALDLVLEHLARTVGMNPRRGVVEDARRGAFHLVAGFAPRFEVANDGASVEAVRLEIGRAFEE